MLWEVVRKEPISHWLMLWSSSGTQEARKEIGSTQPRWSVYCCSCIPTTFSSGLLTAWKAMKRFYAENFGFIFDNISLCCPCVCISSLNLFLLLFAVDVILIGLDCLPILFIACVHFPHTYCLS